MEQNTDNKKKRIHHFEEVKLRESEFKKACDLDSSEFKNIRDEYFKRIVAIPLIAIFIAVVVFVLWIVGQSQKWYMFSAAIDYTLIILLVLSLGVAIYMIPRCIYGLIIVSKIDKKEFWWHAGRLTRKKRLWIPFGWNFYYIVDDEYCSRTCFDPIYFKGTEVYFLYFPGFMKNSLIGGVVVKKHNSL